MTVEELQAILADVVPVRAFRDHGLHGGKMTWTYPGNIWRLNYAATGGKVGTVVLTDEMGMATVSLNGDGVGSLLPILKAVGAVSA
jgi:hypothetical protein